jgi:hypothetical protein
MKIFFAQNLNLKMQKNIMSTLTILTLNVNKASVNRCNFWFKLLEIDFDVATLQEVREIPRFMENFLK